MLRWTSSLARPARALVGTLRQCVRWESSGNRRSWNLRAPDGWIYARHLKQKYGKNYVTKQEWSRQNGTWKGTLSPVARPRGGVPASDPPRPTPSSVFAGADARELQARTRAGPAFTCIQREAVPKLAADE